jgi:hypothetical protein
LRVNSAHLRVRLYSSCGSSSRLSSAARASSGTSHWRRIL